MRTLALVPDAQPAAAPAGPLVEVVVPVHNEQHVLEASIWRLHGYLEASFPFSFRITVADNASTDATWLLAKRLAERFPAVRAVHVPQKGRGRALRQVWGASDAAVVRGRPKRELVSRCYNLLLRATMRARFSDAQCGFKAGRAEVVRALLPAVEDQARFFDTGLLLAATALLYLWALSASGWANDFYSAAAQAASQSWKAFFFGSSDASNFITVDKPPAALWVMGLSARLFGVSSWSLLAPQALMGVPQSRCCTQPCATGSGRRPGCWPGRSRP